MKLVFPTFCRDADITNSRVLGAEVVGENIDLAYRLERRLTRAVRPEDCIRRALTIQGETRAVTLETQKLQFAIAISLGDVWIEIQKVVNVAAIAGKVDHLPVGDSSADSLIGGINDWRFGGYNHLLIGSRNL